jgi:hypothetical protein
MIMDGTALYSVINALHGGGNPTTFARITLIHSLSVLAAVKPHRFSTPAFCIVQTKPYHVQKPWLLS